MKVYITGVGPGDLDFFTDRAKSIIKSADIVLSSQKRINAVKALNENTQFMGIMDTVEYINKNKDVDGIVCIAASGDTGFYSIASTIAKKIDPEIEYEFVCGIGSLSYLMSKLGKGYENTALVSLHGREKNIVSYVSYNENVFALTGGKIKAKDVASKLCKAGLGSCVKMTVGENLTFDNERIVTGTSEEILKYDFCDLSVIYVHNQNYVNRYKTLKDGDFIRGKSPMTKEAVRNLSVSALEIEPSDVVYDIGAGTGAVTCALAYKAFESTVYAVEKNDFAVELIEENRKKTGAYNIEITHSTAPDGLSDLPACDKVFIGGSTGHMGDIIDVCLSKNPKTVFVVNAITLETISQAVNLFSERNMETEIMCANIAVANKLGRYNLMKAENPVYIIKGMHLDE